MRVVLTLSTYSIPESVALEVGEGNSLVETLADACFDEIGDYGDERFQLLDVTTPGIALCKKA